MTTQRESRLSRTIMDAIRARGHFVFKVHGSETMMAGLPDLIVCAQGHFIGLEVKHPETRDNLSARQRLVHQYIRGAGGSAYVVTCVAEALAAIEAVISEGSLQSG